MATNTYLTIDMITRELLRLLENNLSFAKQVSRDYDDEFGVAGAKIGDTLRVRKPSRFLGRTGRILATEDYTEQYVNVQLTTQFGVDLEFTSKDLLLSLDDFSQRILRPAGATIANKVDRDGLIMATQAAFHSVGQPGTVPNTLLTYLEAGAKLDDAAAPRDGQRAVVIGPWMQATIVNALQGLFHSSDEIERQYEEGNMGTSAGFKWSMDQNVQTHQVGPLGGTPVVGAAGQTGSSIATTGWTAVAALRLRQGDVITIGAGGDEVYGVNPQSRQSTGELQQFVVTANVSSAADGTATIPISPAIIPSGQYQTVVAAPAAGAEINVIGTTNQQSPQGIAFHRDAFTLVCADLPLPNGTDRAARVSSRQLGLSIRMIRDYDIVNDLFIARTDLLYGWAALYPELSCRIWS
jgi:hypothetical protein